MAPAGRGRQFVHISIRWLPNIDTIYYDRTFHTLTNTDVTIPGTENEYGYLVDEEGEYQQLMSDIAANTEVEREPVYSYSGYAREGVDNRPVHM